MSPPPRLAPRVSPHASSDPQTRKKCKVFPLTPSTHPSTHPSTPAGTVKAHHPSRRAQNPKTSIPRPRPGLSPFVYFEPFTSHFDTHLRQVHRLGTYQSTKKRKRKKKSRPTAGRNTFPPAARVSCAYIETPYLYPTRPLSREPVSREPLATQRPTVSPICSSLSAGSPSAAPRSVSPPSLARFAPHSLPSALWLIAALKSVCLV